MRTRPDQAEAGVGGGRAVQRKAGSEKKIRGRQAGGLGFEPVHVCVREEERKLQANVCCVCQRVYVCVCVFVHACALTQFLSFLCLTTEWEKARQNLEIQTEGEEEKQAEERKRIKHKGDFFLFPAKGNRAKTDLKKKRNCMVFFIIQVVKKKIINKKINNNKSAERL